jgi:hypothetical protein
MNGNFPTKFNAKVRVFDRRFNNLEGVSQKIFGAIPISNLDVLVLPIFEDIPRISSASELAF